MKNEHKTPTRLLLRLPAVCPNPSVAIERWLLALWQITPHSRFHLWWKHSPITLELLSTKQGVCYQVVLTSKSAVALTRSLLPTYFPGLEVDVIESLAFEPAAVTLQSRLELTWDGWVELADEPALDLAGGLVEAVQGTDTLLQWMLRPAMVRWEKRPVPGFWLAGRLIVSGPTRGRCVLHGRRVLGALGQHAGANRVRATTFSVLRQTAASEYPRWPFAVRPAGKPCSPAQVAQLVHPPQKPGAFPAIAATSVPRLASAPTRSGLLLGEGRSGSGRPAEVRIPLPDLMRHLLVVGPSGTGKTTFLAQIAREALLSGAGVSVFDPHGGLVETIAKALPEAAEERTAILRIADTDNPIGINPFQVQDGLLGADAFVEVLRRTTSRSHWGPVMDVALRHVSVAMRETGGSLLEGMRLLEDEFYRDGVLARLRNAETARFLASSERSRNRLVPALTRLQRLTAAAWLRNILGQRSTTIDFRTVMDRSRSLLFDLSGLGLGGARLVGSLLFVILRQATLSRRPGAPAHVVILDEGATFLDDTIGELLDQARKFNVALVTAVQRLGQLEPESLRNAMLANVGSTVVFRLNDRDEAHALAKRSAHDGFSSDALMKLPRWQAYAQLTVRGDRQPPAWLRVPPPSPDRERATSLISRLVQAGRPYTRSRREVEAELRQREAAFEQGEPEVVPVDVSQDPFADAA